MGRDAADIVSVWVLSTAVESCAGGIVATLKSNCVIVYVLCGAVVSVAEDEAAGASASTAARAPTSWRRPKGRRRPR